MDKKRILNVPDPEPSSGVVAVDTGKVRKAEDVALVDKVLTAKKNRNPWKVISLLVEAWAKRSTGDFNAFKIHMKDLRETRKDSRFGTTPDKDMDRRMILAFPQALMYMIRSVYKAEELPMDRTFYREFAKRFRFFQVPDKI